MAGTHLCGELDNFEELTQLCGSYNVWLHLQGHAAALLAVQDPPALQMDLGLQGADSITITPEAWFGLVGAPACTYFRQLSQAEAHRTAEISRVDGSGTGILALPLWVTMELLGLELWLKLENRSYALHRSEWSEIASYKRI